MYNHFRPNKNSSSMRFGGYLYDIERIEKNKTTWEFKKYSQNSPYGDFILNNDSLNPYGFTTSGGISIIENQSTLIPSKMNQSRKPLMIKIVSEVDEIIDVIIHESTYYDNGYSYNYYNVLTFQKF